MRQRHVLADGAGIVAPRLGTYRGRVRTGCHEPRGYEKDRRNTENDIGKFITLDPRPATPNDSFVHAEENGGLQLEEPRSGRSSKFLGEATYRRH